MFWAGERCAGVSGRKNHGNPILTYMLLDPRKIFTYFWDVISLINSFMWGCMSNDNENEAENEKKANHIDTTSIDLGQDMDKNVLNINCVSGQSSI